MAAASEACMVGWRIYGEVIPRPTGMLSVAMLTAAKVVKQPRASSPYWRNQ